MEKDFLKKNDRIFLIIEDSKLIEDYENKTHLINFKEIISETYSIETGYTDKNKIKEKYLIKC
jgi:hypothetical protein